MSGKLTTHALDISNGCPARGMTVELWRVSTERRAHVKTVVTNDDGRVDHPLLAGKKMKRGAYELVFHVAAYFAAHGAADETDAFLQEVPVRFYIADPDAAYHVPLVFSPWAYSTYRGS